MYMRNFIDLIESGLGQRLLEVVLFTPVETVLAPYLSAIEDEPVKRWFLTNFRNWLLKQPENLFQLPYLPPTAGEKQQKAFAFHDLWEVRLTSRTQTLIGHLIDFFHANRNLPRLERMSVENVEQAAEQWVARMNAKAQREPDDPTQVEVLMRYPNGFTMVQLLGQNALSKEGDRMGHCVGGYCHEVTSGTTKIFSLRDAENSPHATIELTAARNSVEQIKGRQNRAPVKRYWPMIRQFLESIAALIERDYKNVGLLQITDDDTGERTTLTQDQFRDMVLDPNNARGVAFLNKANLDRHIDEDTALGLFVSLYGTDRLTDAVIKAVFRNTPDLAVQAVASAGNHFSPHQLTVALTEVARDTTETIKEMLRLTKPDATVIKTVAGQSQVGGGRYNRHQGDFMLAVAQELPQIYASLLTSDPEFLSNELQLGGARAAGPFYVFLGTDQLTAAMVEPAFAHTPEDAMKRVQRAAVPFDDAQTLAAFEGLTTHRRDTDRSVLARLLEYTRPSTAVLMQVLGQPYINHGALGAIVELARQYVPDQITQDVAERALIRFDEASSYTSYFASEPTPGAELQAHIFKQHGSLMHYVQVIDPAIWPAAYESLRPETVEPTKTEAIAKKDRAGNRIMVTKNGYRTYATYERQVKKDPADYAREVKHARDAAIKHFLVVLDPLLREPSQAVGELLDPSNPKMEAGRKAFAQMNKSALFALTLKHLNREATVASVIGKHDYHNDAFSPAKFAEAVKTMRMKEIMRIMQNGWRNEEARFGLLLRNAPERTAEFLQYWFKHNPTKWPWEKFAMPLEKEAAFAALANVWESQLADVVKDQFAAAVLKRFKPSPANLLSMLKTANNRDVTERILKKTKKPSPELLDWAVATFPVAVRDIVPLAAIPDASLVKIFDTAPALARALMDRDIRDYGKDYKWGSLTYRKKIDREAPAFQRYAAAAEAAGKADLFAKYARRAELDDTHDTHDEAAVTSNLLDYDGATLIKLVHNQPRYLPLYFKSLAPAKVAALIDTGMLSGRGWNAPEPLSLRGVSRDKLEQVAALLARKPETDNPGRAADLAQAVIKSKIPLDDERFVMDLIKLAKPMSSSGGGDTLTPLVQSLKTDAAKNWVADFDPHLMDRFEVPTAHMVEVLFDRYGEPSESNKRTVPYMFESIVKHWFGITSYYETTYRPNPVAAQLIKDAAIKRGGDAIQVAKSMFKRLALYREKAQKANG